jgi:two-component system invasion response regulator UvrY
MIRILIADDHAVVRRGIREILVGELGKTAFVEAQNAREVLDYARKQDWEVIILDISMPGRSGIDILRELRELRPRSRVLVLSMHPEEQFARRALRAGAAGYLTKDGVPEELVGAVRKLLNGRRYVSATLAEQLAVELAKPADKPAHESLSDREFQILQFLASGKTVSEIAQDLALSIKTVSTYRSRLLLKLEMKNNSELIRYAIQNHLVE